MPTKISDQIDQSFAVVNTTQREENRIVLQPILTDLIAFSLAVKQFHWNVTGPHFRPLHLHLDGIYSEVLEAIDSVAERLTACGYSPLGTAKAVATNAEVGEVEPGFLKDDKVLLFVGEMIHELSGLIRSRMAKIEDVDTVTADILHQIVATLEKHHWMLRAQRS